MRAVELSFLLKKLSIIGRLLLIKNFKQDRVYNLVKCRNILYKNDNDSKVINKKSYYSSNWWHRFIYLYDDLFKFDDFCLI